jgi:hypothetical protein
VLFWWRALFSLALLVHLSIYSSYTFGIYAWCVCLCSARGFGKIGRAAFYRFISRGQAAECMLFNLQVSLKIHELCCCLSRIICNSVTSSLAAVAEASRRREAAWEGRRKCNWNTALAGWVAQCQISFYELISLFTDALKLLTASQTALSSPCYRSFWRALLWESSYGFKCPSFLQKGVCGKTFCCLLNFWLNCKEVTNILQ